MRRTVILGALVAATAFGMAASVRGQQRGKLSAFMKPKLDHSKLALEGLSLENYSLIEKSAGALKELSEAAEWKVSPNVIYLGYSREFQRLADDLERNAKAKNLDGATLAYVQLTINCVNCHKFSRDNKLITALPERAGPALGE